MPMSARTVMRSRSVIRSICRPLTRIVPESGRSNPRMSLSKIDFPAPLAPSRILMLPVGTRKLMSRRTTCSSKANDTLSNTTAHRAVSAAAVVTSTDDVMSWTCLVLTRATAPCHLP